MATSAVGLTWGFYIGANKVAEVTDVRMTINGRTLDASSIDSAGWEECIAGLRSGQFQVNGMLIVGDTNGFIAIQSALFGGASLTGKLKSSTGGYNWTATVFITQGTVSADLTKPQAINWTMKTSGAVTPAAS
jgi:predicted secreted protein